MGKSVFSDFSSSIKQALGNNLEKTKNNIKKELNANINSILNIHKVILDKVYQIENDKDKIFKFLEVNEDNIENSYSKYKLK